MKLIDKDSRHEILDINISEKHIFLLKRVWALPMVLKYDLLIIEVG
jgi:hypothetical protein